MSEDDKPMNLPYANPSTRSSNEVGKARNRADVLLTWSAVAILIVILLVFALARR